MDVLGYVVAFLAIVALIIVHEWGHFQVARWCKMRVERFSIFFGPVLASFKRGETQFQLGTIPLGGFVQITGMNPAEDFDPKDPHVYPNRPVWQRLLTIFAGPGANYLSAVLIGVFIFGYYGIPEPTSEIEIQDVLSGRPAAKAGLKSGDVVLSIDGQKIDKDNTIPSRIEAAKGKAVVLRVARGPKREQTVDVAVTPEKDSGVWRIGVQIAPVQKLVRQGMVAAVKEACIYPYAFSIGQLKAVGQMLQGKQKAEVSGPVRITSEIKKSIDRGALHALTIMMNLSIYLGLFNLLPVPALDGGRLAFLCIELVSRKRVNQKVEASVHMVGFVALFLLMVVVLFKDIFIG
jgi:regulator of sigma E protease